jgi:hypothetical protein
MRGVIVEGRRSKSCQHERGRSKVKEKERPSRVVGTNIEINTTFYIFRLSTHCSIPLTPTHLPPHTHKSPQ